LANPHSRPLPSHPGRRARQPARLGAHPDLGVLLSAILRTCSGKSQRIDERRRGARRRTPSTAPPATNSWQARTLATGGSRPAYGWEFRDSARSPRPDRRPAPTYAGSPTCGQAGPEAARTRSGSRPLVRWGQGHHPRADPRRPRSRGRRPARARPHDAPSRANRPMAHTRLTFRPGCLPWSAGLQRKVCDSNPR
jgi:hypothetical protein